MACGASGYARLMAPSCMLSWFWHAFAWRARELGGSRIEVRGAKCAGPAGLRFVPKLLVDGPHSVIFIINFSDAIIGGMRPPA
jgi:hypothetical protein